MATVRKARWSAMAMVVAAWLGASMSGGPAPVRAEDPPAPPMGEPTPAPSERLAPTAPIVGGTDGPTTSLVVGNGTTVADLLKAGVLAPSTDGQLNVFTKDYAFSSPSAAAAMVAGRQANGRIQWLLDGTSKTYGEWQDEQVSAAAAPTSDGSMAEASTAIEPIG